MTDLYQAVLDDRDRLLEEIEKRDIRIAELERAISLRDQLIAIEEGEMELKYMMTGPRCCV
jgi:hypothetical protein